MNNKYFVYALFVTIVATWSSWSNLVGAATGTRGGSSWSSHSGSSYGGGGGHK